MNYKVKAHDKKNKTDVAVIALFVDHGKIVSVQTHGGVFPSDRFIIEIDIDPGFPPEVKRS